MVAPLPADAARKAGATTRVAPTAGDAGGPPILSDWLTARLGRSLPHCAPVSRRSMGDKNLAKRRRDGSVKRPHDVAEQFVGAKSARQEALPDGEIDDDLKRTAVGLDAEAKRIELGYAGFGK